MKRKKKGVKWEMRREVKQRVVKRGDGMCVR